MARITGKGGTVSFGGSVSYVTNVDFNESEDGAYGQTNSTASFTALLDDTAIPYRVGATADLIIAVSGDANWTITMADARVKTVGIPVSRDSGITQQVSLECYTTATIA